MKGGVDLRRLRDLVRLLDGLRMLHDELFRALETKIEAMRRADVAGIQSAGESEQGVVLRMQEREGFRLQLMAAIGDDLGLSAKAARSITVSQLASRLPDPERGLVLNAASRLQAVMAKSAQANRLAATLARDVVRHMKWVFSAVRRADAAPVGYTVDGRSAAIDDANLFEAVG